MATEDWRSLREAPDYRAFLKAYLEESSRTFSDLARAAGFGRGFPNDVISGRRRLTSRSAKAFARALKLPPAGRQLFQLLVARDERDQFAEYELATLSRKIEELRARPWKPARRDLRSREAPNVGELLKNPTTALLYAAAGGPGAGATFAQLQERTRLSDREIESALRELERAGILVYKDGSYEPADLHLFLRTEGRERMAVEYFQSACRALSDRAAHAMDSDREMFFSSCFCIDESRLPELKSALRATILKFVDDSIARDGDRVVRLVAGLHL